MDLLLTITLLFAIPVLGVTLYLGVSTVASFLGSRKDGSTARHSAETGSILCIVPAHDEAGTIGETVRCLMQKTSDGPTVTITVIADNCTDSTAQEASQAGAQVYERNDPLYKGKGQALDWFIRHNAALLNTHPLTTIIDADTRVSSDYFRNMSVQFTEPKIQAVQAFYDVANPFDGWRNMLLSIALRCLHHTRPSGRTHIGGSAGLKGNGMMFRSSLLLRYGWPADSIVEDLEFSLRLAADGIRVMHTNTASVYGDMPFTRKAATTQRTRWEGGRWLMVRAWLPRLVAAFRANPTMLLFDCIMDLLTPPLVLLVLLQCAVTVIWWLAGSSLTWCGLLMLAISTAYVLSGLIQTRAPFRLWLALAAAPAYILWKITVYIAIIGSRQLNWIRSEREGGRTHE